MRIWASKLDAKSRPLEVFLATFPETLKTLISDDPSMVLAGLWGHTQRLFVLCSVTFFTTPFGMAWGTLFCVLWLPLGVPWEAYFEQNVDFFLGPFLRSLVGLTWGSFGRGRRQGRRLSNPAGSARTC